MVKDRNGEIRKEYLFEDARLFILKEKMFWGEKEIWRGKEDRNCILVEQTDKKMDELINKLIQNIYWMLGTMNLLLSGSRSMVVAPDFYKREAWEE